MNNKKYEYKSMFTGHSRNARKLLISKYISQDVLALMTDDEVESIFGDKYIKKEYVKKDIEEIIKDSSDFDELRKEIMDYIKSIG